MAVVGIDLGTTYSVIATPQKFEGKYFQTVRGVTIIKDDSNQRLTPSVVAVDRQGNLRVGRRAKAQAGQQPEPIMFVKRTMGEAREFSLGDRRLRPEEVSAEILHYLKTMAEKQMGEPIEEAVITVPAYFTTVQKQKTKEAGERAGLRVGEVLQEPVAAALMYCYDDTRDPLTIMTYDLGGGTFDVAVLCKQEGGFDIKAFDGDRNLGGYDFDKRLAFWIVDRLNEQGYQLNIDPQSPQGRPILSKLLVLAETAKEKLTEHESFALVDQNTGILDARGEPVAIDVEITRETFESLIQDYVDETVRLCWQALEKAGLAPPAIDEIVMVGGSSRIPLVSRRLEAEFGRRPRLVEPDLSVAVGAALMAQRLDRRIGPLKLGYVPEVTDRAAIQITGTLERSAKLPVVVGCTVVLAPADGSFPQRQQVGENGGFIFRQVPLAAGVTNSFALRVEDPSGQEVVSHRFAVRREAAGASISTLAGMAPNVLAKPIAIMTVAGLHVVAAERTPLPCDRHVPAQTTDQRGRVRIPVYEDTYPIGEIVVESVPRDLPVGSRVDVTLTLRRDFYIEGRAHIPAANVEGRTTIQMPPVSIKGMAELQNDYLQLSRQASEALAQADQGQAFKIAPRLKGALAASQKLLYEERDPNLAKLQELLAEIETRIRQLNSWQPNPPQERFEQTKQEIEKELLPDLYTAEPAHKDGSQEGQLNAIVKIAEKALAERDSVAWADANRRLDDLRTRIGAALDHARRKRQRRPEEPPDPHVVKLKLRVDLTQLREEAQRQKRLSALEADFKACEQALKAIDAGAANAMARLAAYYEESHQPLQEKIAKIVGREPEIPPLPPELVVVLSDQRKG